MESSSLLLSAEIHRRLKRFYGKLSLVTSPANWLWPIHGLDGASRLEKITDGFLQSCRGLRVHLLEFAFEPAEVQKVLSTANAWSPPPPPAKSNQYQGTFQSFLGVRALHLEVSVQPLMTRQGGCRVCPVPRATAGPKFARERLGSRLGLVRHRGLPWRCAGRRRARRAHVGHASPFTERPATYLRSQPTP